MAKTPFIDLKSEDILSAHISGIQHSINKLENVLNLQTATKTGHALVAVADQADATLHHFIYEGTIRNWLSTPAPVVKRDGIVVSPSEYIVQPAYGVIVFETQQDAVYNITADFTHVIENSSVISGLDSRVGNLEAVSGGGVGHFNLSATPKRYTNIRPDVYPGQKTAESAPAVTMALYKIDAVPMILTEAVTFTKMSMAFHSTSPTCNNLMGIYSNKNIAEPDQLLAETGIVRHNFVAYENLIGNLLTPITLQPGTYWLARWHNDSAKLNGSMFNPLTHNSINPSSLALCDYGANLEDTLSSGVRSQISMSTLTALPITFPAIDGTNGKYLMREGIGALYAIQ